MLACFCTAVCSQLGCLLQVLNTKRPAVRCVITGNWFINWFVPVYFPKRLVDKEVARRFKLNRCGMPPSGLAESVKKSNVVQKTRFTTCLAVADLQEFTARVPRPIQRGERAKAE